LPGILPRSVKTVCWSFASAEAEAGERLHLDAARLRLADHGMGRLDRQVGQVHMIVGQAPDRDLGPLHRRRANDFAPIGGARDLADDESH
jgi:hypothetical protein